MSCWVGSKRCKSLTWIQSGSIPSSEFNVWWITVFVSYIQSKYQMINLTKFLQLKHEIIGFTSGSSVSVFDWGKAHVTIIVHLICWIRFFLHFNIDLSCGFSLIFIKLHVDLIISEETRNISHIEIIFHWDST